MHFPAAPALLPWSGFHLYLSFYIHEVLSQQSQQFRFYSFNFLQFAISFFWNSQHLCCWRLLLLPPFSLICDFEKQNIRRNVVKISVNHACYRQIGSKPTNHSPLAWCKEGLKVTLVVVIGGFRSDLSITPKTDGNFGKVSAGVSFSKVAYQRKQWLASTYM